MSLSTFLFSDYRQKVLALLLLNPNDSYHQREIARLTDTLSGTLSRELTKMVDVGLLHKMPVGNQMHYTANQQCPIFEELVSILRKTGGWVQTLTDALKPLTDSIDTAFVFGSFANSDIDLMIIGDAEISDLIAHLHPLQHTLGRAINPKQYAVDVWHLLVKENGSFVRDVLSKPKVFVMGNEQDLLIKE
ncbi:MAG: polymerase subunit beta [Pseudomonas sp.]|nr:polymerase subunit beta [Pseudomonas sp.]